MNQRPAWLEIRIAVLGLALAATPGTGSVRDSLWSSTRLALHSCSFIALDRLQMNARTSYWEFADRLFPEPAVDAVDILANVLRFDAALRHTS